MFCNFVYLVLSYDYILLLILTIMGWVCLMKHTYFLEINIFINSNFYVTAENAIWASVSNWFAVYWTSKCLEYPDQISKLITHMKPCPYILKVCTIVMALVYTVTLCIKYSYMSNTVLCVYKWMRVTWLCLFMKTIVSGLWSERFSTFHLTRWKISVLLQKRGIVWGVVLYLWHKTKQRPLPYQLFI